MSDILAFVILVLKYGWGVVPVIVVLLVIAKPERADKLKEIVLFPLFRLFKAGARQYIASTVAYSATTFIQNQLRKVLRSVPNVRIKIRWVSSDTDPIMKQDGTLIVCLRDSNDQTRNILSATQATFPHIVFPALRTQLERYTTSAVDLTLLHKLSIGLGKHSYPTFLRYFLGPQAETDARVRDLFSKLVEIDNSGTFVAIFLEELNQLSDLSFETGDQTDKNEEVLSFMEYLLGEARRGIGEEIRLGYSSAMFKVGIILLAKSHRALTEGARPYMNRLDYYVKMGFDSIYLVAYSPASEFYDKLIPIFQGDDRVNLLKSTIVSSRADGEVELRRIALYRRVPMFVDQSFAEKVTSLGLAKGTLVTCQVLQVAKDYLLADIRGLNGIVHRKDCSWRMIADCGSIFAEGSDAQFVITEIDSSKCQVVLSGRTPETDPWRMVSLPRIGDEVKVKLFELGATGVLGLSESGVEVFIPRSEQSWTEATVDELKRTIGNTVTVEIIDINNDSRKITGSIKRTITDPWPGIAAKYPPGTTFRGQVIDVDYTAVRLRAPSGEIGILPRSSMIQAGFEYTDFEKTVVPGQGIDVVVRKVNITKHKMRLDLQRNVTDRDQRPEKRVP